MKKHFLFVLHILHMPDLQSLTFSKSCKVITIDYDASLSATSDNNFKHVYLCTDSIDTDAAFNCKRDTIFLFIYKEVK